MIRLPLVADDPGTRRRVELLFGAMWQVKRALQRDARAVVDAYWAGDVRRERDAKAWRAELGLSRTGLEHRAYAHVGRSRWLGDHVSKALAMHQADEVWIGVARHLHPDASGRRAGRPRTGSWWEYTRIPGRARSHTVERKWETFRLHGTLTGHLNAFRHPALPGHITTPAQAAALPPGTSVLAQPRNLPALSRPTGCIPTGAVDDRERARTRVASWFDHTGPLSVVFASGPNSGDGDLVLPVRLPQGAGRWSYLAHYLSDPAGWHKVDLVRRRDATAPGGWTYEAHLMVLTPGYASPATRARRIQAAALGRVGGVDGNVSNLAVVSFPASGDPDHGPVGVDTITLTEAEQHALMVRRRKAKGRQRALDRSRRSANPAQYRPSRRQQQRDERRHTAGLPPRTTATPAGPRRTTTGKPTQPYCRDQLSNSYRTLRARHAMAAAREAEAKHHRAKKTAAALVAVHGPNLTIEDCDIRTGFRLWGRACSATTPGRLITALAAECTATGGRLLRASTFTTALSQHCLCGRRVPKSLRDRVHHCDPAGGGCGLRGDRDPVSAALAAFTTLANPHDPATARLDHARARAAQILFTPGLQEALSESTAPKSAPSGRTRAAARTPETSIPGQRASARRNAGSAPWQPRMRPDPRPSGPRPTPERHDRTPHYPERHHGYGIALRRHGP
ncbi:transposase [Streptomyces sp. NBS 14/10]|uniref:transposase n=1 Tax=Streptomyces sp. NBS 14/10 TaxID=1945643 RepID=UPI00211B2F31|nr:transposase [Streptomyces sp. NBS 14/10]KAK1181889.1 transposase [Streptomyces sp. NBS 14/10]